MPPKGAKPSALKARAARARAQKRAESSAVSGVAALNIASSSTKSQPPATGGSRSIPTSATAVVTRNYQPKIDFSAVEIEVCLTFGRENYNFPDQALRSIPSTMGRCGTQDQIYGILYNNAEVKATLEDQYGLLIPQDIEDVAVAFRDNAGGRVKVRFDQRWDSNYAVWAGEVESGEIESEVQCSCIRYLGEHKHKPEMLVKFFSEKVKAVLNIKEDGLDGRVIDLTSSGDHGGDEEGETESEEEDEADTDNDDGDEDCEAEYEDEESGSNYSDGATSSKTTQRRKKLRAKYQARHKVQGKGKGKVKSKD